jgi:hypothetical protein
MSEKELCEQKWALYNIIKRDWEILLKKLNISPKRITGDIKK